MKLTQDFENFLKEEVNLNTTRIDTLTARTAAIESFLQASDWNGIIQRFSTQGSWAHKTIIKPPGAQAFDVDLVVYLTPVAGWTPKNFVVNLRALFNGSGIYKDKTTMRKRCVTLSYAGDFEIDIVPCVVNRLGGTHHFEICNRTDNIYEPSDGEAYADWLNGKNSIVGMNKLREIIRILKYLRDIKTTFSCKSILLTTMLGEQITHADLLYRNTYFPDLPTALRTLICRLDSFLENHPKMPRICNPILQVEEFTRHWDDDKYANFREVIQRYRGWVDDAYHEVDEDKSREKWQRIFGSDFGKTEKSAVAKHESNAEPPIAVNFGRFQDAVDQLMSTGSHLLSSIDAIVPWMKPAPWPIRITQAVIIRATAHSDRSGNTLIGLVSAGDVVPAGIELKFEAFTPTGLPYTSKEHVVKWQVTNTDRQAWSRDALRGDFYPSKPSGVRWEKTEYRGIHWVQAFVISKRTGSCIAQSDRFFVPIR